jgi:hypothetical protein
VKQILALKDLISHAKFSAKKAGINAAESIGEVAKGSAKAASTLNPFVIASYAVSAIGIIASIRNALSASKSATGGAGGVSMPSIKSPSAAPNKAPDLNVIGSGSATANNIATVTNSIQRNNEQPLKAYVVESEVTSSQSLASKSRNSASM